MTQGVKEADSLSNFTSNPVAYLEKLRRSGAPLLLTAEGQGDVVIQDAASYQRMLETVDRLEAIAAVKEGLADVAAGRTRPIREVLEEVARKHNLPPVQDE
jgi:PHD/YefM family antitoxin component YafN of YafNO toxin-antitoxin module